MPVITPQSDVKLLKVPIEIDNQNQLTFANATAQFNYFNSLPKLEFDNFTYQRKDGTIRIPEHIDNIISYNYVMYRNEAYSNKWFYAFISDMTYLNDMTTEVSINTDVFQTWQFDLQYKRTFIEREHTNDDTIGNNTIPEGLEYGEPVIAYESYSALDDGEQGYLTVFACTKLRSGQVLTGWNSTLGGVFNSLYTFACESYADAMRVIECYNSTDGISGDDIQNIYLVPKICVNMNVNQAFQVGGAGDNINVHPLKNFVSSSERKIQQQNALYGNYVPVNNKLYCYPYSYIYATNNAGESVEYRWEDFKLEKSDAGNYNVMTARYHKDYVATSGVSAKLRFINYKNQGTPSSYAEQTWSYGMSFGKIPVCAWTTDYYTNWLTQNGINTVVSTTSSVVNSMASMAIGNVIGGATSLGSTIGGLLGTMQQVRNTPNQAKGDASSADVGFTFMSNIIQFFHMTVRPEFARIIDDYFSTYGYKTNRIKLPNVNGRRNWNYVKTVGCYIRADIPQSDLQEIKSMFDRGVTFWHNPATFLDYSQPNPIV